MFVIVAYDVAQKRVSRIMKICRKYLHHVQNSVFEGMLTEGKLDQLKRELHANIRYTEDSVCIYEIQNLKYTRKESIGINRLRDNII